MQVLSYDKEADIMTAAATVCASICRNLAFIDGNNRAAFGSLGLILGMNGYNLDVSERESAAVIIALAA
jgi:death-on-curing protein